MSGIGREYETAINILLWLSIRKNIIIFKIVFSLFWICKLIVVFVRMINGFDINDIFTRNNWKCLRKDWSIKMEKMVDDKISCPWHFNLLYQNRESKECFLIVKFWTILNFQFCAFDKTCPQNQKETLNFNLKKGQINPGHEQQSL
jgi:hypothetical protein